VAVVASNLDPVLPGNRAKRQQRPWQAPLVKVVQGVQLVPPAEMMTAALALPSGS
jgi:hypothetical protein